MFSKISPAVIALATQHGAAFEYAAYDQTPAGMDDDAYAIGVWLGLNF